MNSRQKEQARRAIRLWVKGDAERSAQENPLAARHRFTEQVAANGGRQTVKATQTRQSGGSQPITYQKNSYELARIRRIMEMVREYDNWSHDLLREYALGVSYEKMAQKRNTEAHKYGKTKAIVDVRAGLEVVGFALMLSDSNLLSLQLKRSAIM